MFQRYPQPEECQSSLIYNGRSLDLICKDKDEAEVWFFDLNELISHGDQRKWRAESRSDGIPSEATSPRTYTRRSSPLHSLYGSVDCLQDESVLIWFSGKEEKHLSLIHLSRTIAGKRTLIFQRYPWPEYQSSLIYNDRSLDLICKDKDKAEVWFSGLNELISRGDQRKWRTESRSDGIPSEATSPRAYTRRSSPLHSLYGSGDCL